MNLTFKRKLVLLYFLLVPLSFFAAEPFRDWKNQNSKLKPIEAQLLEYSEAFDRKKFSKYYQDWLGEAGIDGDILPGVKLRVKIPQGRKKEPAEERDYEVPLAVLSESDKDYILDWHWLRQREDFFRKCLKVVLGESRDIRTERPRLDDGQDPPPLDDLIYLRNGSRKRGTVINNNYSIHTPYGEFVVGKGRLAAVQFEVDEAGRSVLTGVNSNRLSGFLDLPGEANVNEPNFLVFESNNGQESVRKEEVSRIIFQVREDELDGLGTEGSVSLRLANGDYLDAKVYEGELPVGGRSVKVSEVDRVEVANGQASVFYKDGGRDNWAFAEEDLPLALDLGPAFSVYHGHLKKMYCDTAFRPLGFLIEASSERDVSISFDRDAPGRVRSPSSSSNYYGILEEGDKIVSINREMPDFESRDNSFDKAVDDLFDKKEPLPKVEIGIQRGENQFFLITLFRKQGDDV